MRRPNPRFLQARGLLLASMKLMLGRRARHSHTKGLGPALVRNAGILQHATRHHYVHAQQILLVNRFWQDTLACIVCVHI